jgi:hypothetical protein
MSFTVPRCVNHIEAIVLGFQLSRQQIDLGGHGVTPDYLLVFMYFGSLFDKRDRFAGCVYLEAEFLLQNMVSCDVVFVEMRVDSEFEVFAFEEFDKLIHCVAAARIDEQPIQEIGCRPVIHLFPLYRRGIIRGVVSHLAPHFELGDFTELGYFKQLRLFNPL